jgi:hypothetical protein
VDSASEFGALWTGTGNIIPYFASEVSQFSVTAETEPVLPSDPSIFFCHAKERVEDVINLLLQERHSLASILFVGFFDEHMFQFIKSIFETRIVLVILFGTLIVH